MDALKLLDVTLDSHITAMLSIGTSCLAQIYVLSLDRIIELLMLLHYVGRYDQGEPGHNKAVGYSSNYRAPWI